MEKYFRNGKEIKIFQYTQKFKDELISNGEDEFEDTCFVSIQGMCDTEFEWNFLKKELKIIYSNFNNWYEFVTKENFRTPDIINIGDYIVKEDNQYHLETKEYFEKMSNNFVLYN